MVQILESRADQAGHGHILSGKIFNHGVYTFEGCVVYVQYVHNLHSEVCRELNDCML